MSNCEQRRWFVDAQNDRTESVGLESLREKLRQERVEVVSRAPGWWLGARFWVALVSSRKAGIWAVGRDAGPKEA